MPHNVHQRIYLISTFQYCRFVGYLGRGTMTDAKAVLATDARMGPTLRALYSAMQSIEV